MALLAARSSLALCGGALRPSTESRAAAASSGHVVEVFASRVCDLTGKRANNGYLVSFSHRRTHTLQQANLQHKRVFWEEGQRWITLRLCTKAIKSLETVGLDEMAKRGGVDLLSLPYVDYRPERLEWVAAQKAAGLPVQKPRPATRIPNPAKQAAKAKAFADKQAARK